MDIKINRRYNEKNLPDMKTIKDEAHKKAASIQIGMTPFFKAKGVKSEAEYKRQCMKEHKVMTHSHIGWNDVKFTEEGFKKIYETLNAEGVQLDRLGVCLDGSMGVPESIRDKIIVGSGQVYRTPDEWKILPNAVPVCVHMGDHMIGSCNSTENVLNALSAGVTTIGNISHYFSYEYPGIDMEEQRTIDACTAIGVMACYREGGTIIHSNLDDGNGGQIHDVANLVGWAMLERYFVEELLGAGMNHCFGNLFSDPMLRIIFSRAMWEINTFKTPGSMIYGNTVDFGDDYPRNYAAAASFSMADIIGQRKWPTGCAVTAIPVTEAVRVPSAEEIIEAQEHMSLTMEKAEYYAQYLDFDRLEVQALRLVDCGRVFFERVLNGLDDLGVDITHAGEVMTMLKAIGAEQLEIHFGSGKKDMDAMRTRIPVWPTNIIQNINKQGDEMLTKVENLTGDPLKGVNIVMGTTDIHVFGKEVVKRVLREAGATIYDLDQSVSTQEVIDTIIETESKIVCISTYNGMALSFAEDLKKKLDENKLDDVLVMMGGRINEAVDGDDIPQDVTERVAALGFNVDNETEKMINTISSYIEKISKAS